MFRLGNEQPATAIGPRRRPYPAFAHSAAYRVCDAPPDGRACEHARRRPARQNPRERRGDGDSDYQNAVLGCVLLEMCESWALPW